VLNYNYKLKNQSGIKMTQNMPEGFVLQDQMIYGMRKEYPGLFEMKIHNPKKKNAIASIPELKMKELVLAAQDNEDIKVILLHGGSFYSSGNDLSLFGEAFAKGDPEEAAKVGDHAVNVIMVEMLMAFSKSKKPIVAAVRGGAIGIGFTMLAHTTFLYCSPEAFFKTPFMESGQSPEGTSTLLFPRQLGTRLANECLLNDKVLSAQEAVNCGFANGIIDRFEKKNEWFDPSILPVIPRLLKYDYRTLTNMMEQLNYTKDMSNIEAVTKREGKALVATWADPAFMVKMMAYMK
jgi:enoyl-CoA hydratase/carnithine racemase